MKYCSHCGKELIDEAVVCVQCGCSVATPPSHTEEMNETIALVIKIFMIIGCVTIGWALIPLAWAIPMTVSVFRKLKNHERIGMGMKICTLLFVNLVAGICLLCADEL